MNNLAKYSRLYKSLSAEISSIDPGSLGGAYGEYDKSTNEIIRIVLEQQRVPTSAEIANIFNLYIGDFPSINVDEIERLVSIIKKEI